MLLIETLAGCVCEGVDAGGMEHIMEESTIDSMIDNPQAYGFSWGYGHLKRGGMVITQGAGAPYMVHEDVAKVSEAFGDDYFLEMANGTSGKVRDQGVIRNGIWANKALAGNMRKMKQMVLQGALNVRRSRTAPVVRIFVASDGTEFADKNELLAYEAELTD